MVCSREVAAFSSPPRPSKISAMCCAVYVLEPLKRRCSMKWETPAFASVSSREPAPIQKPIATERTCESRSEMTRSPESSSVRTYRCTDGSYSRCQLGSFRGRNGVRRHGSGGDREPPRRSARGDVERRDRRRGRAGARAAPARALSRDPADREDELVQRRLARQDHHLP